MKRIWNFFKGLFIVSLILFISVAVINAKTDFFFNIGSYVPVIEEKYPLYARVISDWSKQLASLTSSIPTPKELIASVTKKELPIDPSDLAVNSYISDSPMLNFYPNDNICIQLCDNNSAAEIFGVSASAAYKYMLVTFTDGNGVTDQTPLTVSDSGQFYKYITLPKNAGNNLMIDIYAGENAYGQFSSRIYNYVPLEKTQDGWQLKVSPVYEHNKAMYETDKSLSEALKSTPSIQAQNDSVASAAADITQNAQNDYEKALLLHDWMCSNLYYDTDNLDSDTTVPFYATEVLENKSAVCLGFATLYAALCRSINIPCNVVSGYALGIAGDTSWTDVSAQTVDQNHAWNEVYADGRWVIVDMTWDTQNKIQNGEWISSNDISHVYFDSNIRFFSQNHKIIEYTKRR